MSRTISRGRETPNPIDIHVGSRVRMRRLMLGLSQTKHADALGLTFQQVHKDEKGINRIGAGRLLHIAHVLQIQVAFLFEGGPRLWVGPNGIVASRPIVHYGHFLATSDGLALSKSFMR